MICEKCGKEKAVFHIVEKIGDKRRAMHICGKCKKEAINIREVMDRFLESIDDSSSIFPDRKSKRIKKLDKEYYERTCLSCGYSMKDFMRSKTLSCPKCYESFRILTSKAVKKIHDGNDKHIGKKSNKNLTSRDIEEKILKLTEELELFIRMEEYEKADLIKNRLETLEKLLAAKKTISEKKDVRL